MSASGIKPGGPWGGVQLSPFGCQYVNLTSPLMGTSVVVYSALCPLNVESAMTSNVTFSGLPQWYNGHVQTIIGEAQSVDVSGLQAVSVTVTAAGVVGSSVPGGGTSGAEFNLVLPEYVVAGRRGRQCGCGCSCEWSARRCGAELSIA